MTEGVIAAWQNRRYGKKEAPRGIETDKATMELSLKGVLHIGGDRSKIR